MRGSLLRCSYVSFVPKKDIGESRGRGALSRESGFGGKLAEIRAGPRVSDPSGHLARFIRPREFHSTPESG
jgi:hypothetical protein